MKLNSAMKKAAAKWPILLLLLMMPALVLAQQDDKDKKKNPPPPPPKKSDTSTPKQTPPPNNPPHHDPPPNNPPKPTPPNQTPPPTNNPPKRDDPNRDRGRRPPEGNPPNGGQPGQPKGNPTPPNGGPPPNGGKPTGQPVPLNPGQPGQGNQPPRGNPPNGGDRNGGDRGERGGQPNQGNQPPRGNPPNGGQQNGGQPNNGRPFGGQPGQQNGSRNREPNRAPVPAPQQVRVHNGNATVIRAGGNVRVTTIRTQNVVINRTDYGRRVVTVRPGGVTVVSIGNNRGFVQRPSVRVGFVQRTYVVRGRPYVRVYRNYNYRGIAYVRYVPAYYYSPRFYVWAYNPWVRPVYFGWGWGRRAPWFYGGYFAPAPFYVSASLWLTDYIIAENLRASYEAQLDAQGQQYAAPPPDNTAADPNDYNNSEVSPALRQAIADEVQRQLNAEKNAAGNPQAAGAAADDSSGDQAPPALAADQRVFVVSAPLQVYDGDQPCSLTAGDVISRIEDSPGNDNAVGVSVLSSKQSDCRPGAQARVQVTDLQDMSNDLRAQTDEGLKKLSTDQGKNGLPPAPDVTQTPNPNGQGTPDPDAVNQLNQQRQDADQTEKEVGGQNGPGGSSMLLMPGLLPLSRAPLAGGIPLVWRPSVRFTLARYF